MGRRALSAVVKTLGLFREIESLQRACILALGNLAQADSATIKELKETGKGIFLFVCRLHGVFEPCPCSKTRNFAYTDAHFSVPNI